MSPGSQEAIESGCRCDRALNRNGDGRCGANGYREFYPSANCPVHGDCEEGEEEA